MATGHEGEEGGEGAAGGEFESRRRQLEGLWGGGGWDVAAPNAEA